ncbi:acetyl-CoA carboxylase, biotin carboxyl carrier protein [Virgibacillus indicus]|uniref:Biotin carboxyl carrier protein of acetyl-CoA carboxylase n=1 Tax=Virgibacillus indicus TaxID=2024554 RepID=A0A265NEX5_9BACI|nr:acetyl-CoA carboxylase biotin carboxyl carrier protein [Virgibacillus indicus]OZU90004.1 acetyl-CoA carboxylase, biotin carboxyl carrier protein [Virgibacillus indicus]
MLKVQEIREIIKLIDQSSISEFTYETNGTTVSMKKNNGNNTVQTQVQPVISMEQQSNDTPKTEVQEQTVPSTSETPEKKTELESKTEYDYEIVSPMVGTLYTAASPESDPYVSKGSAVEKDTVVCIVEAMKLFNEIEAEVSGEIVEILAEDGELVEYGQPLFRVKSR